MNIIWQEDKKLKHQLKKTIKQAGVSWVKASRIFTYRSINAKTRAYARIWGLSRIWQKALKVGPAYILEVISEKYDKLSDHDKSKVLLHEVAHIPKNFSGALVPHIRRGKGNFNKKVNKLIKKLK
ncbi:metallopeptidase [Candidatus Woesebacteria bacterium CG22_combo_CG10-13_8_21_14_all_39_10]|uniref:Metallopeptidase n=3 Tax=Candidatus Woeseibacteriota TaxID=1752722 RepID=A0A2M7APU4_9BACT|nr:MAG: metallopeptidase [Candidatus Woesebacteria bacterium CG22_combo_CG10-13_8_21_14_all_39_10]PIU71676.1 MAG: metallopeptidase [Candidatus Woesebacteria bacterium CG06_land_8_20_14_3_00_39_27]PIZ47998.1 MAG: metallopeptidase [Candidatus Woesebacteria bacterium CG_4_10_14_0_2_um_filter_39_14]